MIVPRIVHIQSSDESVLFPHRGREVLQQVHDLCIGPAVRSNGVHDREQRQRQRVTNTLVFSQRNRLLGALMHSD